MKLIPRILPLLFLASVAYGTIYVLIGDGGLDQQKLSDYMTANNIDATVKVFDTYDAAAILAEIEKYAEIEQRKKQIQRWQEEMRKIPGLEAVVIIDEGSQLRIVL